ncbi:MAG: HNH endonuclease [Alphaproteobacteria bacterium]|nr:HNH endonuclease [Alphaproteobacteria bacterium]
MNIGATTFSCIYCGRQKPEAERSLEHIWPEGLAGKFTPDFFKTREACGTCNNLLGQFVDGEFQRSFFTSVEESGAALTFLDTTTAIALPLVYMGTLADQPSGGEVCESWLGPRGERIYFLHAEDRADFASYAGGDPIKRKISDGGRVYMSFSRPNAYWIHTAVASAREKFRNAEFRLLTVVDEPTLLELCSPESDQSAKDRAFLDSHWRAKTNQVRQTMLLDHGARFQCKLALGFGSALFGRAFQETDYETLLRKALWERDPEKRANIPILGTPVVPGVRDGDEQLLGYPGAYTFAFMRSGDVAMVMVYLPSTRSFRTVMAPESQGLSSRLLGQFNDGFVVLLVPGLQAHFGPIHLTPYVLHRHGGPQIPELVELESKRKTIEQLETDVSRWNVPQNGRLGSGSN